MDTLTIPTTHSAAEASLVMADTARLLRQDAKNQIATARAVATTPPPSASDVFFTYVGELMDAEGISRAQAMRRITIGKPTVHAAYIQEFNEVAKAKAVAVAESAARARRRRQNS